MTHPIRKDILSLCFVQAALMVSVAPEEAQEEAAIPAIFLFEEGN